MPYKGWGIKVQVGRTHVYVRSLPFCWEWRSSMMAPSLYGVGVWVTRDRRRNA